MNRTKIITMYLPQFHSVPENDMWWGKGFTDWITVKKAKQLFDGHDQPHIPLDENYYDLLEKKSMVWQAELMHQYGIEGMCIYHYWFKDGRRILEKPVENLLEWRDIDMPFCLCWANETWARSWSNISGAKNTWADTQEKGNTDNSIGENGILLLQDYGREEEWRKHVEYLLPFFSDDRYIKINGKPLVLIYRVSEISCIYEMLGLWRKVVRDCGFPDLYVVGGNCTRDLSSILDGQLYHEPQHSIRELRNRNNQMRLSYSDVWNRILQNQRQYEMQPYFGGFVRYDDTPRRGEEGTVVENDNPEVFKGYLAELIRKNSSYNSEIVFLNAWNEWGEGMYLEPDTRFGFDFLRAIKEAKELADSDRRRCAPIPDDNQNKKDDKIYIERINGNLVALSRWLSLYEYGIKLAEYIGDKYPRGIVLYGFGVLGRHLYDEIVQCGIKVNYIIEKNPEKIHVNETVYTVEDNLPDGETVIVSAIYDYDHIYNVLKKKGDFEVLSLSSLIDDCLREIESK